MTTPTWPGTLPPPQADTGTTYGAPNNVIESAVEAGASKRRRRFTAVEIPFTCSLKMTQAQLATLEAFYYTTLAQVLPFDWVDFRTGITATYHFTKDGYTASYLPGSVNRYRVTLSLARQA